jgi:hypothetical protein
MFWKFTLLNLTCLQLGGSSVVLAGIHNLYSAFLFYYVGRRYGNLSTANEIY